MSAIFTEANYENSVIELFRNDLGYEYVYGPDISRVMELSIFSQISKRTFHCLTRSFLKKLPI